MTETMQAVLEQDIRAIVDNELPWERLSGTRVVVTGAAGFLGNYLVRTLMALHRLGKVSQPVQVVAMVRGIESAGSRFADLFGIGQLELLEWDFNAIAIPDLGGANYVFHAASQASPRFYGTDPVGTLLPNTIGTASLLHALRQCPDPRGFVFVSSSEVYGAVTDGQPLDETHYGVVDPATVRACYAESKRAGETMCVAWHHQYGLPTYIVRPFHTYGPGLIPEDGRVFADFSYNVARNENIVMNSDGTARRAFCYATDAIAGFMTVLLLGKPGVAYNVSNPAAEMSVIELAEMLVALFPEKRLQVDRRVDTASKDYLPSAYSRVVPDVAMLLALGWTPRMPADQGFRRMIETFAP